MNLRLRGRVKQPWIPIETNVLEHRKTQTLAELLDVEPEQAFLYLLRFWFWCTANVQGTEGYLQGISARLVARAAKWPGDPTTFYRALVNAEFVDEFEQGPPRVHGWAERYGKLVKAQDRNRRDVAEHRAYEKLQGQLELEIPPDDVSLTSPLRQPDVSLTTGLDKVTEERRGEESRGDINHAAQPNGDARSDGGDGASRPKPVRKVPYREQYVALCVLFGVPPDSKNPLQARKFWTAAAALGKDGVTAAQIAGFPAAWRKVYPGLTPSPIAYATHASELLNGATLAADTLKAGMVEWTAEDEAARDELRAERAASGLPNTPAEWAAYHDAQRKGETWQPKATR